MTDASTFFSLPVGANPNRDQRIGVDELGRAVYRAGNGQEYAIGETFAPDRRYESDPGTFARVRDVVGNMVRGGIDAFTSGVTAPARAARGEPVTYGDAFEAAGMAQLGGAAMPAPRGALRSGALRMADDVPETPAAQVARLLREGRASEITDDLMAQADPQEMYRLYEGGETGMPMPMDEASRMARAGEMGFDAEAPVYHGSLNDITGFRTGQKKTDHGWYGDGVYFGDADTASIYAMNSPTTHRPEGGNVIQAATRGNIYEWPEGRPAALDADDAARISETMQRDGYAGANVYAPNDYDTWGDQAGSFRERVIFNPRNIRSRFARFDPRLSHLANLNAANASPLTGIMGAQAGNRDEEVQRLAAYLAANGGLN